MKRLVILFITFGMLTIGYKLSFANEEHTHPGEGGVQTLTGEVVDLVCYISHGDKGLGPKHADCAKKCIKSGLPVAIKVENMIYIATNKDHSPANNILAQYAGKTITVIGEVVERDGVKMVVMETIKQ